MCSSKDKKPTYEQLNQWIADHYSVISWSQDDGTCLVFYMLAFGHEFTSGQVERAFDLWLIDYKEYRKTFE